MKTRTRRRLHVWAAVFFVAQIPVAIWLQVQYPVLFERWWKLYLIFLSIYAVVVGHLGGASAETPTEEDDGD